MDQERRSTGGQRVPFEALVVVASPKGGAGAYECEAVDLSEKGMHLRTAYLPDAGQTLTFRFETGSGEVSLEGEVVWREEQARGGEFGVRFVQVDEAALTTLREALGLGDEGAEGEAAEQGPERVERGSRVRLHIDGLGSPMRARVRDDHTGEVLVGSNLDFLKVGKPLELEDVERGKRRCAVVDKVEVEVDPASKVPQLVVTLRYEEGGKAADVAKAAAGVKATADSKGSRAEEAPRTKAAAEAPADKAPDETKAEAEAEHADGAEADPQPPRFKDTLAQVGGRLALFGASAKAAMGTLIERARARRDDGQTEQDAPRRVTAPPPDGGIQISSLRPQRSATEETVENNEELNGIEETDEESLKARKKQRMMVAAGAGLLAVLLVVFGVRAKSSTPPPGAEAASTAEVTAATAAFPGAGSPAASGDVISANVPLFGTTPLSTTEPAPLPPTAQAPAPAGTALAAAPAGQGDDDDDKGDEPSGPGKTEYGKGEVKKPRTIRIKMDAPITDLRGTTSGDTLTIFLPGRRNVEPAATLAKRDKRLSSIKAVPKDGGLEVSLAFKDSMPPFLAKANGKMLEVDLGQTPKEDGDEGSGQAAKKHSKKSKIAKGSKAADKKKATAKKADKKKNKKKKHNDDLPSLAPPKSPPRRTPAAEGGSSI